MRENIKIRILPENRFIDYEISYYMHRFPEEGIGVDFLTRLWGNPRLTFKGLEWGMEVAVDKSLEGLTDRQIAAYQDIIVPAGYVADMLRYAEKPGDLAPAVAFLQRLMQNKTVIKGAICHALWIFDPIPAAIHGRRVTCHNNIIGSVKNAGAFYVDEDIVIDDDLVTARTRALFAPFARTITKLLSER